MAAVKFFSLGCVGLLRRNVNVGNKLPQGSVGREIFVSNYDIFVTILNEPSLKEAVTFEDEIWLFFAYRA